MTSDNPDKSSGPAGGRTPDELMSQVRFLEAEVTDLRRRVNDAPTGSRGLELRLADAQRSLAAVTSQNERLAQTLLLSGELRVAEPKTLRYRLWHVAARIIRHARRVIVRLQRTWPWATALAAAFTRLRALPLRC